MDIIYSLPSVAPILKILLAEKPTGLLTNNPIFKEWTKDKDSIEQKRVGNNVIYFKGTWTERAAIATPADFIYRTSATEASKK